MCSCVLQTKVTEAPGNRKETKQEAAYVESNTQQTMGKVTA